MSNLQGTPKGIREEVSVLDVDGKNSSITRISLLSKCDRLQFISFVERNAYASMWVAPRTSFTTKLGSMREGTSELTLPQANLRTLTIKITATHTT